MSDMNFLKAERISEDRWRVLAIPFGGPKAGKDTDGEYFSINTDVKADWFEKRPTLWHHGLDGTLKDQLIGDQGPLELEEDTGWWAETWLNRANRYWEQIAQWLAEGKVFGSSGALGHLVRKDHKTGEILVWPHIEQTLTLTPANPFARVVPAKAVDIFDEAGIALTPAVRGLLSDLDSPTADLPADLPADEPADGDAAAIQRLGGDTERERLQRRFVTELGPRIGRLIQP